MVKRKRRRRKRNPPEGSTRAKGDIVEQLVAAMHKTPDVKVETNVYLSTLDGKAEREIDILVSSKVAGYPVNIAIECKNEKKPTGVDQIDAFVGKLKHIGIPTQYGVFVSSSRYRSGAIARAQEAGIKTLLLKDTTEELSQIVRQSFQSVVFLLANILISLV